MKKVGVLLLIFLLSACAVKPETMTPVFEPDLGGPVWPLPPETPRYAYAGTLVGEKNFLVPKEKRKKAESIFTKLAQFIFGEPDYIELKRPVSGLVDALGRVLVVDASHQAILVFDMTGQRLDKWDKAAQGLKFVSPVAISEDGSGGFWVTDAELGEIFRLNINGKPIGRKGKGMLARPTGIAQNPKNGLVYVTDTGSHDLKVFDKAGNLLYTVGKRGVGPGEFNSPTHLTFVHNKLYVTDTLNFRIQVLGENDKSKLTFGNNGINVGNMARPKGVAVGEDGRIYVVESYFDHLLVFDDKGQLLLPIGGTGQAPGQFYLPGGVWTDKQDKVYVADMFNGRVSIFKELTGRDQ